MVRDEAKDKNLETAEVIYFDTQIVAALYEGKSDILSRQAKKIVDRDSDLRMGPMVLLELELLYEIRRIRDRAEVVAETLAVDLGIRVCETSFADVARQSLNETWTRDPFDRLIVAQARLWNTRLITRDVVIQKHYSLALD